MTNRNVIECDGALLVQTERMPSLVGCVLSAVAAAGCVGIAGAFIAGRLLAAALAVVAASIGFLLARQTRKFELRVTGRKSAARGKVGDSPGNLWSVPTPDVQRLESQEDAAGPEMAHHPGIDRSAFCPILMSNQQPR